MKKQIKIFVSALLCLSVLLSFCLIVHNSEHNCIGEDCQLCRDIALQRELMKSVLMCVLFAGSIVFISEIIAFSGFASGTGRGCLNLVNDKIKLTA